MITVMYGGHEIEIDGAGMTIEEIHRHCRHVLNLPPLDGDLQCCVAAGGKPCFVGDAEAVEGVRMTKGDEVEFSDDNSTTEDGE